MGNDLVLLAEIVGVHGIRGVVKLKVFSDDPDTLLRHAPLYDADKKKGVTITSLHAHGNVFLAEVEGIKDRTIAEKLRGTKLFIDRSKLPKIEKQNTYYHSDLIGLSAQYQDGRPIGKIINVANFGAGDLLEIKPQKGTSFYVPFTNKIVPEVNIAEKRVVIDPPEGLLG